MIVVMRPCSLVVLSNLDAGFEPRCGRKDFLCACGCCCCLLKCVAQPWPLKGGVKPRQGNPSSVIVLLFLQLTCAAVNDWVDDITFGNNFFQSNIPETFGCSSIGVSFSVKMMLYAKYTCCMLLCAVYLLYAKYNLYTVYWYFCRHL